MSARHRDREAEGRALRLETQTGVFAEARDATLGDILNAMFYADGYDENEPLARRALAWTGDVLCELSRAESSDLEDVLYPLSCLLRGAAELDRRFAEASGGDEGTVTP